MTAQELLKEQLEDAGYQLDQALAGMAEEQMDTHAAASSMTPREQIEHLCEAYQAFITAAEGGKHQWGSFKIADRSTPGILTTFRELRSRACVTALGGTPEVIREAHAFIVAHDYYHVGQLCAARLAGDPNWNAYSIYKH